MSPSSGASPFSRAPDGVARGLRDALLRSSRDYGAPVPWLPNAGGELDSPELRVAFPPGSCCCSTRIVMQAGTSGVMGHAR
eukprot:10217734-Alexandrium_andersonii.AAC.1